MLKLYVIVASTRPGRQGTSVGKWFDEVARKHAGFDVELIELAEVDLPLLDEPHHPRLRKYEHEHTKRWSARIDAADAFVFVTPEYNYSAPPSLLNAIDYLLHEWTYKPVGFVSYGGVSAGLRSVQMTKQTVTAVGMVPLKEAVSIPFSAQYVNSETGVFDPGEVQVKAGNTMLDELLKWATALKAMRAA
jgi:NAD(P)H-dependent FMN reductase